VKVARSPAELDSRPRAVAIGVFDGVHLGHRAVVGAAVEAARAQAGTPARTPTVVTFDPHPRTVLGNQVDLLSTLDRRIELLAALGIEETLVVEFTPELGALEPEAFARAYLQAIGAEVVVAGAAFRFGRGRGGDLALLEGLGLDARPVPIVDGISSTRIRTLVHAGDIRGAARLLGRPPELDGTVVSGDARGGTLGFPTANLRVDPRLLVPPFGIYAGAAAGHRAAVSVGVNPHYGGSERRVEAFLLDFQGDLYGQRLVIELWERLRDEAAFASERELVAQIAKDVEAARAATRPA
jgi:riboflavin kinase/FMN adenylyltransferase